MYSILPESVISMRIAGWKILVPKGIEKIVSVHGDRLSVYIPLKNPVIPEAFLILISILKSTRSHPESENMESIHGLRFEVALIRLHLL